MDEYHIAVIVGSLRKDSFNRRLANALADLAPAEFTLRQVRIGDLPLYRARVDGGLCLLHSLRLWCPYSRQTMVARILAGQGVAAQGLGGLPREHLALQRRLFHHPAYHLVKRHQQAKHQQRDGGPRAPDGHAPLVRQLVPAGQCIGAKHHQTVHDARRRWVDPPQNQDRSFRRGSWPRHAAP